MRGPRVDRAKETRAAEALAAAAVFFREQLPRHAAAKELLAKRGLSAEEAAAFGIGAAPDAWDALKAGLASRVAEEALLEAGLLQRNPETGRVYDRFRNRLTIEIRDGRGEILGFGARAFGDDMPKYLNSPETSRFSKGKLLYGLDQAKEAIRRRDVAILVEGYFDRIALARAGCENAVASMGTALTPAQADLLSRHAATVVVAYDGDPAGLAASYKAFPLLLARGANVKHMAFPSGHDPDSFLREKGPEALREELERAAPLVPALLSRIPLPSADPSERAARLREAVEILGDARDPVLRHEMLSALARGAGVPLSVLSGKAPGRIEGAAAAGKGAGVPERLPEGEERVLCLFLADWPQAIPLVQRIPVEIFSHPIARRIFTALKTLSEEALTLDFSSLESHVGADAGPLIARLLLQEGATEEREEGQKGLARLHKPLLQLKIRHLEERALNLQPEIHVAESSGDSAQRERLLTEKQALSAEIRRLKQELRRPASPG
jgi:DNA primase